MAQPSSPADLPVIGAESLDNWTLFAGGGFGQVFKARHKQWGWDVAIKILSHDEDDSKKAEEQLLREIELMQRGGCPYVMTVLGIYRGCVNQTRFVSVGLVMELMERGSLESLLQKKLKHLLPWSLVFRLAHQVALGMNYLHSLTPALIHKDLKPDNILLDSFLNVKITDFGIARFANSNTVTAGAKTNFFAPPESFNYTYTTTCAFDVYSYAILLWTMLNPVHKYVRFDVCGGDRPSLAEVERLKAPGLEELVKLMVRCWDQIPDKRPCFKECIAVTGGLYEEYKDEIGEAIHQVQKELDGPGPPKNPREPPVHVSTPPEPPVHVSSLPEPPVHVSCPSESETIAHVVRSPEPPVYVPRPPVPRGSTNREDFLQHSCQPSMDENTMNYDLILSEKNMKAMNTGKNQSYRENPHRFTTNSQVLSKESLSERCYFEVKWSGWLGVAVSYIDINRQQKGLSAFGMNDKSWMLRWYPGSDNYKFRHNSIETELSGPRPSTIFGFMGNGVVGVDVDHRAGTVSFYHVNGNTMAYIHTVNTTFTQPLYAGIYVGNLSTAEVCKIW